MRVRHLAAPFVILVASGCSSEPRRAVATTPDGGDPNTPEAQGIDSTRIVSILDQIETQHMGVHSLTILRHDHVVLDADFFPYDRRRPHDFASCTKALTTTALGFAIQDGRIGSMNDLVVSYFPDHVFSHDSADERAMTLGHAASMTSGFDCVDQGEATLLQMQAAPDWIGFALDVPMAGAPGSQWRYCSTAMHVLSGVVGRATGEALDDYLAERLFTPIGAARPEWPRDPQGNTHGWGDARLMPGDMLRVAELFLAQGQHGVKRLLDPAFIDDATKNRVGNLGPPNGYGYGWWTTNGRSYYASGRGGQLVLIAPLLDAVLVATGAESPEQAQAVNQLWSDELAEHLSASALPPNPAAARKLALAVVAAKAPPAAASVPAPPAIASTVAGRRYRLDANPFGWDAVSFDFAAKEATLHIVVGATNTSAAVGLDAVPRITRGARFSTAERHADIDIAMNGVWLDDRTFQITFDTIDTIEAGTLTFAFEDDAVTVTVFEKTYVLSDITFGGTAEP